jgi:hypothetical protein
MTEKAVADGNNGKGGSNDGDGGSDILEGMLVRK